MFMTRSLNVMSKTTERNFIVRVGKSEAEVTNLCEVSYIFVQFFVQRLLHKRNKEQTKKRVSKYWPHQRYSSTVHLSISPEVEQQSSFLIVFLRQEIFKRSGGERVCRNSLDVGAVMSPVWLGQKRVSWPCYITHWRCTGWNDAISQVTITTRDRSLCDAVVDATLWCNVWQATCTETRSCLTQSLWR